MVPFISIVMVVRNQRHKLGELITVAAAYGACLGTMCEVIVVDNASTDGSIDKLKQLAGCLPDIQVFTLSRRVSVKMAERVGLENALGDLIVGSRVLNREELNMELQAPVRRGITLRITGHTFFVGVICDPVHIAQEFGSQKKTRRQRLNIEQAT